MRKPPCSHKYHVSAWLASCANSTAYNFKRLCVYQHELMSPLCCSLSVASDLGSAAGLCLRDPPLWQCLN
jgi:hypothetical protein